MKQESLQKTGHLAAEVEKKRDRTGLIADLEKKCAAAFGLKDGKVAFQILTQAANLQCSSGSEKNLDNFSTALGTLSEIAPRGALEMLLAVQMMGVYQAALKFLANATPVIGTDRAKRAAEWVWQLERQNDLRELIALLA